VTLGTLFAEGGLTLLGVVLAVVAIGVIVGAGFGYFTASGDLKREQSRAWALGVHAGKTWADEWRDARPGEVVPLPVDPYTLRSLTPAPPVHSIPTPPRAVLFDQDDPPAPPKWPVAPRVVVDDGEVLSEGSGLPGAGVLTIPRALLDSGEFRFGSDYLAHFDDPKRGA